MVKQMKDSGFSCLSLARVEAASRTKESAKMALAKSLELNPRLKIEAPDDPLFEMFWSRL